MGISSKAGDLEINVMKGKKLTNMRTQNTDENVVLTPVRKMAIAEQLSLLNTDEALEIHLNLADWKLILDPTKEKGYLEQNLKLLKTEFDFLLSKVTTVSSVIDLKNFSKTIDLINNPWWHSNDIALICLAWV